MKKRLKNTTLYWSMMVILIHILSLMGAAPARADSTNWVVTEDSWFTASNWDNEVPTPSKDAFIENGGTAIIGSGDATALSLWAGSGGYTSGTITQNGGTLTLSADVNSMMLGLYPSGSGYYNLLGGGLSTQSVVIGDSGYGEFRQSADTIHTAAQGLTLGQSAGGTGTYNQAGGTLQTGFTMVGLAGTGTFTQSGGTHITNGVSLGQDSTSQGTYNLNGGSLTTGVLGISNGEFLQKPGTNNSVGVLLGVSAIPGGEAKYTMQGGTLETFWEDINNGTFTQTGGDHSVTDPNRPLFVGGSNGPGYFNLEGGTLSSKWSAIGPQGYGEFLQKGESIHTVAVGMGVSGPTGGKYTLEGGTLSFGTGTWLQIGAGGTGTFTQTGGDVNFGSSPTTTNNLRIGLNGGTGSYSLQPLEGHTATLTMDGIVNVGVTNNATGGTGYFYQSGGTHSIFRTTTGGDGGRLLLGNGVGTYGYYELSGGHLEVGGKELLGLNGGTGVFVQSGGTNTMTGYTLPDGVGRLVVGWYDNSVGTYTLSGGEFRADRIVLGDSDSGTPDQPLASGQGTLTISGGNLVVKELSVGLAADQGSGGFGKLDLASQDAYVEVSQTFKIGPIGIFTAAPGATIHMTGSDYVNSSTTLENMTGLANLKMIFSGGPEVTDTFEVGFDLNTLEIGPNSHVRLVDLFDNITKNGILGDEGLHVATLILGNGAILDKYGLSFTYDSLIGNTNQIVSTPIPGSLLLLGTGLLGLGAVGWRRRQV